MNNHANISDELRAAIEVAKQRVEVDSYHDMAVNKALKGHGKGYWAGTIIGLTLGASIGGLLVLATGGAAALWPVLGISGATGAGLGGVIGSRVGISASAIAGVIAEKERREKGEKLEAEILANPEKQAEVIQAYREDPVVKKDDTIGELFATHSPKEAWKRVITPKAWAITIAVGAAIGAFIFGLPFSPDGGGMSAFLSNHFEVATKWGAAGMGAIAGAGVGTSFGLYMPGVLASVSSKMGDVLSGKMFDDITNGPTIEMSQPTITHMQQPPLKAASHQARSSARQASTSQPSSKVQAGEQADQVRMITDMIQQPRIG